MNDLGEFLRAARARIQPESVGLPRDGRRRVPGLRREEVAELIGVSETWYARFESGRAAMSLRALERLADGLRFSPAERRRFLSLALPDLRALERPELPSEGMLNVGVWSGYRLAKSCAEPQSRIETALWSIRGQKPTDIELAIPEHSYLFCLHLRGAMSWNASVGDRRVDRPITEGTLNMAFPGDRAWISYRDANLSALHVYISRSMLDSYVRELDIDSFELTDPANREDTAIVGVGYQMANEMKKNSDTMRLRIEGLGLLLLANLLDRWSNRPAPKISGWEARSDSRRLRRVVEYLDANRDTDVGLTDIAQAIDLPLFMISAWFAHQTGMTLDAWIDARRTEAASLRRVSDEED